MASAQRAFTGGEVAPSLYARTDLARYATALRTCRNFLVQRHGGVQNRPGSAFVAATRDGTTAVRLLPFVFNDAQTYVLELGDQYLRLHQQGAPVVVTSAAAWVTATAYAVADLVSDGGKVYSCTTAHTSGATTEPGVGASWQSDWYVLRASGAAWLYEIPTPWLATDLAALKLTQSADVMTLVHPSYAPRQLARLGHTRWTLVPVPFGPTLAAPASLANTGGAVGLNTNYAVTALTATGEESLAATTFAVAKIPTSGSNITLTWAAVSGAAQYAIYRGRTTLAYGRIDVITALAGTPTTDSTWGTPSATVTTTTKDAWVAASGQARNATTIAAAADRAVDGKYTVTSALDVSASGGVPIYAKARVRAYYSRNGEARVDAGALSDEFFVSDLGTATSALAMVVTVPDLSGGYTSLTIDLVPEVFGHEAGAGTTFTATVTGTAITWTPGTASYADDGSAVTDYTIAPPVLSTLFDGAARYPACVGSYQQRQLYGQTATAPEKVWASRTGAFTNFGTSFPLQDDDAVSFQLAGRQVNAVRDFADIGQLIVFTQGGAFADRGDVLTPSAINLRQIAAGGIAPTLSPLVLVDTALFVHARGSHVHELAATVTAYGQVAAEVGDLTVASAHLFDGYTIADWAVQATPNPVVWCVRSDGLLVALTYLKSEGVVAWHRHDFTGGAVENVCVVPEGTEDVPYFVVRYTIGGATVRYVLRMASRFLGGTTTPDAAWFVDAGLEYNGWNAGTTTLTLSGGVAWDHGETLTVTASAATFTSADVGNAIFFGARGAITARATVTAYTDPTHVTVRPTAAVPEALWNTATTGWARAVASVAGLAHLEGQAVAVLGDGYVVASPNNPDYPVRTVTAGVVALGQPYAVLRAGLPITADLETLDLDLAGGVSIKGTRKQIVNAVTLSVEGARAVWAGAAAPPSDAVGDASGLDEFPLRALAADADENDPTAAVTEDVTIPVRGAWNTNGRVFVRQVDPLPLAVLAAIPHGYTPGGHG